MVPDHHTWSGGTSFRVRENESHNQGAGTTIVKNGSHLWEIKKKERVSQNYVEWITIMGNELYAACIGYTVIVLNLFEVI